MDNKKKTKISLSSGKGFYITAAVSFCLVIFAIALVYRTSTNMIRDIFTTSPTISAPVTTAPSENITVKKEKESSESPTGKVTSTTKAPTTEEQETSMAWSGRDNTKEHTTVEVTKAVISNSSYILPLTSDIQKGYSPSVPVFDETMSDWRVHKGIDFAAEEGTEVKSVGKGRVAKVISDPSLGYIIEIDHGDFTARYCGLEQGTTVTVDAEIEKGDTVGSLGIVPCESKQESHLHFEVIQNGKCTDPLSAMKLSESNANVNKPEENDKTYN